MARKSAVQIESPTPGRAPSDPPEMFDVTRTTKLTVTPAQLWKGALAVAAVVLAVAAALPNILPKAFTIATQSYVDESVDAAKAAGLEVVGENTKAIEEVTGEVEDLGAIVVKVQTTQNEAHASQEADRVTRHIRNGDRRVRAYDRVKSRALQNLKADPPRDALEGVELDF